MSLSDANVIQDNSGTYAGGSTTFPVTLPSGTTAGNTVVIIVCNGTSATSTGFTVDKTATSGVTVTVLRQGDIAAAATSWTVTQSGTAMASWYVTELSNVDPTEPLDVSVNTAGATSNGATMSTGTTSLNSGLSTVQLAIWGATPATAGATATWSGYTNGFAEVTDSSAGTTYQLAVARNFTDGTTGTFESTATLAVTSGTGATGVAVLVAYRAADAPIVAPLGYLFGYDWGTWGGVNSQSGDSAMLAHALFSSTGTWGTHFLIQAASARNSAYGLRVTTAAAAALVRHGNFTVTGFNVKYGAFGFNVRVVSATGVVQVGLIGNAYLMYDATNAKFGMKIGSSGTVTWQSGTTAANTWVWVDFRVKQSTTTLHVDWRIETAASTYTDQTSLDVTGTAANLDYLQFGSTTAQTMTADFDDVVMSRYYSAYPLGPHEIRCLTVDPAGTPTVSGTTTNFGVFTANTTVGAWNATNARNAVDEVPPTISASADGATQTTVAASDYMQFPMDTYTLSATEYIAGVRMLAPMWSATSAAADIAIRGYDGTTETALASVAQAAMGAGTAISTTAPVWRCAMWQSVNGWTQAELDAAALRVGFSTDATPDIGVHALYLEVAIAKTKTMHLFGDLATAEIDPTRLGTMSITVTAPDVGVDTSLYYEYETSPSTVPVTGGTSVTQQIDSATADDANYIAVQWPPEGVPDA